MEQKFSRREVERSFRKFNDLQNDLVTAPHQVWTSVFNNLIEHCETDPAISVVIEPLKLNENVNAEKWYSDAMASQKSFAGSGHFTLPYDDEDRTALLYKILILIYDNKFRIDSFCISIFGIRNYQQMVTAINQELVLKFTREVSYRLEEILEDTGGQCEIPREAMVVFHYDNSMTIKGNIEGSNIASGGSTISHSSAQSHKIINQTEALQALQNARESISTLSSKEQQKAEVFIGELEEEANSGKAPSSNALVYAAGLLPLLEAAGTAADVIAKIQNIFSGDPS